MPLTSNARKVLELRYLKKDSHGKVAEKPEDLFRRVARNIVLADAKYKYTAEVEKLQRKYNQPFFRITGKKEFKELIKKDTEIKQTEQEFYTLMSNPDFLPNSPTLFNAGRILQQLAGCFVLPVEDDINSIFKTLWHTAVIHQTGGGTGFSFSRLRPRGDIVHSTQGQASGPVSFMKIFDCATEQIKQGGKRRGANMGILRVDHPDIEEFITIKSKEKALQNFNISVAATDAFMKAVEQHKNYPLINPRTGKVVGKKSARKIFHLIAGEAWKNADPGMIFLDTVNRANPTPHLGDFESTNPCAEIPLLPYEACNLASINMAHFVKNGDIEYGRLRKTVWTGVHFLDNVIDICHYPLPEIERMVYGNRKIGLGIMGFADMLIQLGISYTSEKAVVIAEELMKFIDEEAKKASVELAKTRGVFPFFRGSIYNTGKAADRVRNATRTAIAPTGTISIIAGCSSGIEPLFAIAFTHSVMEVHNLVEVNKYFLEEAKKRQLSKNMMEKAIRGGSLSKIKGIPADTKKVFITTLEIPTGAHLKIQAAFQKYVDNAVSKTINLPHSATVKEVEKAYLMAYKLGCKGISVYRYGSKEGQVFRLTK